MKVSISCITYNHAPYIRQCIEGFLMQECDFDYEILIHDDASTDGTQEIIKEYVQKYPDLIKPIYQTENQYSKGVRGINVKFNFPRAKGEYIALCEGDDYWTDPLKLQRQVGFLEENWNYILCFTNRDILENDEVTISRPLFEKVSFDKSEIPSGYVPTLTAVFRNVVAKIPKKMVPTLIDSSLFLFLSQYGSFYYLDISTAVYRVHQGGIYSGSSQLTNYKRSVSARMAAWQHLKHIDKIKLTYVIKYWNNLKKEAALKEKNYHAAAESYILDRFLDLYLWKKIISDKLKVTKNKLK